MGAAPAKLVQVNLRKQNDLFLIVAKFEVEKLGFEQAPRADLKGDALQKKGWDNFKWFLICGSRCKGLAIFLEWFKDLLPSSS